MSNADYVKELLLTCPCIKATSLDMHIDFLGSDPLQYSIDGDPSDEVQKRYLNGDTLRRYGFVLAGRMATIDDATRSQNTRNYEQLAHWLDSKTRSRSLLDMGEGRSAKFIRATGSGYLMETEEDASSAAYQMQCELIYYQKARF